MIKEDDRAGGHEKQRFGSWPRLELNARLHPGLDEAVLGSRGICCWAVSICTFRVLGGAKLMSKVVVHSPQWLYILPSVWRVSIRGLESLNSLISLRLVSSLALQG